jgi:hypothetical protein
MKPIELCQYTLFHSINDTGDYSRFYDAEDLINDGE